MRVSKEHILEEADKENVLFQIAGILEQETPVLLGYVYGSFIASDGFNDIDVAVLVDESQVQEDTDLFRYELSLAARIDLAIEGWEIDLRVINRAPLSFKFGVVNSGRLAYCRDEAVRVHFEATTRDRYFDFLPHLRRLYAKVVLGISDE